MSNGVLIFFSWTQGIIQSLVPHKVLICGIAEDGGKDIRMHAFSIDRACDDDRLRAICDPHDGLIRHLLFHWEKSPGPCLFSIDSRTGHPDPAVVELLLKYGLSHSAAHGIRDTAGRVKGFFSFSVLPAAPDHHTAYLLEILTPYLYVTLARILTEEHVARGKAGAPIITGREVQILKMVKDGRTTNDIATFLKLSPFTIKNHLRKIFNKLSVRNRTHAVARAISLGLIKQE